MKITLKYNKIYKWARDNGTSNEILYTLKKNRT